jgi:transmembrane sensor
LKTTQHIEDLFLKYLRNECTLAEIKELLDLFGIEQNEAQLKSAINDYFSSEQAIKTGDQHSAAINEVEANLIKAINQNQSKTIKLWPKIVAVAAAVALIVIGAYFFSYNKPVQSSQDNLIAQDIAPGKNGATLTLANGQKIFINDVLAGNIASQSGVKITKTKDGQIIYEVTDQGSGKIEYNTLTTTRGEQTQVRLPDGSLVFLNAASSLKYPTSFAKSAKRSVGLTGEGYFEIAKDKAHPFVVETDKQNIIVLGTHFNVKAYSDEPVKTTLVEGSVQVNNEQSTKILKPGQQAILTSAGKFEIGEADQVLELAWKNNEFMFESESIQNVMKMVERWYNVEVIYQGEITKEKFGGGVSRFDKVSVVLALLERTGAVKFKIADRKIYVMNTSNK